MAGLKRLYFRVTGNVQGVGFRWFAQDTAKNLALTGWVRNVCDGSVEGEIQGFDEKIKLFLSALKAKDHWANVEKIETREISNKNGLDFLIKTTV